MLILTRRLNEQVMIGDDIVVAVLGIKGGQIRLGIDAPKEMAVHRQEIYERIKREQESVGPFKSPAQDAADKWASYTGVKR